MGLEKLKAHKEKIKDKSFMDYSDKDLHVYWALGDFDLLEELKQLPKDTTIYTIVHHVSQSGMMRHVEMFYLKDNQKIPIRFLTEEVFFYRLNRKTDYYHVSGCGMDMGFSLVHSLSYCVSEALVKDGKLDEKDGYYFKQSWF
jgi:hypothetical protein